MATVRANGQGVPISFPIGDLGYAVVSSSRLSARFLLTENSLDIDEEVFDSSSGELTHTIGQEPIVSSPLRQWHLHPGRYLAYGLSKSMVGVPTLEGTTRISSTSTFETALLNTVKIEPSVEVIAIDSDDSDGSSPPYKVLRPTLSLGVHGASSSISPTPVLGDTILNFSWILYYFMSTEVVLRQRF